MAYLGQVEPPVRLGTKRDAEGDANQQADLFNEDESDWVVVDTRRICVEHCVDFGGPWLSLELMRRLRLTGLLEKVTRVGGEDIGWFSMASVLILSRLCRPSSELYIAEHLYRRTTIGDLMGVPADKVNADRLYRALDKLLPYKEALEAHLKNRLGELFDLEYDLLLYDEHVLRGTGQRQSESPTGPARGRTRDTAYAA